MKELYLALRKQGMTDKEINEIDARMFFIMNKPEKVFIDQIPGL
jgi:hypothetical protein